MAPKGQGKGGGRGMCGGSGTGQGGECVCPSCGEKTPHTPGNPCIDMTCPKWPVME